jgi:hypothetical protein
MAAAAELPDALVKDVARCAKKHKAAASAALDSVDKMLQAVAQARDGVAAQQPDAVATLRARLAHVGDEAASSAGEAAKGLTAVVGKLGKARTQHQSVRRSAAGCACTRARARLTRTWLPHAEDRRLRSTSRATWRARGGTAPSTTPRCSRCVWHARSRTPARAAR